MLKKEMDYYIGIKNTDGIRVIKCNNLSCLENAGELLLENYSKKSEIEKLINLGEIDELMETYKETKEEAVSNKEDIDVLIEEFCDKDEILEFAEDETIYLFDKKWFVKLEDDDCFVELEEVLN